MGYMKLEDVHSATKEEVLKATGIYLDSDNSPANIDLGIHKHDEATMQHIFDRMTKYYYLIDIAPESLVCELAVKRYVILTSNLGLGELEWPNLYESITKNFDTKSFLYDIVDSLVKTHRISAYDSDDNWDYRTYLLELIPMYEEHFDHILQVFDAPENQECLYVDIEKNRLKLKEYTIDEVWNMIEKRDMYHKFDELVPQCKADTSHKLKI